MTSFSLRVNNQTATFDADQARASVLHFVRETLGLTGTKEGCGTGDCGACSVVLAGIPGQPEARVVNSCITPLGKLAGANLLTVEGLADPADGSLHPVQAAMIEARASQCGFCTPGFAMALAGHQLAPETTPPSGASNTSDAVSPGNASGANGASSTTNATNPTNDLRTTTVHAIGGNLCRCTGYRPIIAAGMQVATTPVPDHLDWLHEPPPATDALGDSYHLPTSEAELLDCWNGQQGAPQFVAGATDLWLTVTQQYQTPANLIDLSRVAELRTIDRRGEALWIGASVTHRELLRWFSTELPAPAIVAMLQRFGSAQVRGCGTLGGNIANASPIADWPPVLLAVDATVSLLDRGGNRRQIPLESFYTGYRQTQLRSDEIITAVVIPRAAELPQVQIFKNSKRHGDDISSVLGAFRFQRQGDQINAARVAFGGVAATPLRLPQIEAQLTAAPADDRSAPITASTTALLDLLSPLSDVRASADYRRQMAALMLRRAWQTEAVQR